jgi:uncharacterized protein YyaL (SSP411 family)
LCLPYCCCCCRQDADSLDTSTNKKSEGAFYVWTYEEIVEVLGQERASVFCEVYGVKQGGNCTLSARSDPHQEFVGKNVLAEVRCCCIPCLCCFWFS